MLRSRSSAVIRDWAILPRPLAILAVWLLPWLAARKIRELDCALDAAISAMVAHYTAHHPEKITQPAAADRDDR